MTRGGRRARREVEPPPALPITVTPGRVEEVRLVRSHGPGPGTWTIRVIRATEGTPGRTDAGAIAIVESLWEAGQVAASIDDGA